MSDTIKEPQAIISEGEKIFDTIDESIDKKCYEINKVKNWADYFYGARTGLLNTLYLNLVLKTEYKNFFEGLNYEYGVYNYPLDIKKAFNIYKTAADTSNDFLCMFRLYRIYKKEFTKFIIGKRNIILEKYYLLKCLIYGHNILLADNPHKTLSYRKLEIFWEIEIQLYDREGKKSILKEWYFKFMDFLKENYNLFNIKKDDVTFIEIVIGVLFKLKDEYDDKLLELANKGNPEAIYYLILYKKNETDVFYDKWCLKLININYYRSFVDIAEYWDNKKESLNYLKKSIVNGYYSHIRYYTDLFFIEYDLEDIINTQKLKDELKFIIESTINDIIVDDIEYFNHYILMRNILIKYFNCGSMFKFKFDTFTKALANFYMKFCEGKDEENFKKIDKYYILEDSNIMMYAQFYIVISYIYYYGIKGIIDKDYEKSLYYFNYGLKHFDLFDERYYKTYIYYIHLKAKNKKSIINSELKDEDLKVLEKNIINSYLDQLSDDSIKNILPSLFYTLTKCYGPHSINNQDILLEYIFVHTGANAIIKKHPKYISDYFYERYLKYKFQIKVKELDKEENYNKIKNAKGAINIEGYGEDGTICPICFTNKKSTICIPCKHFFCDSCIGKLTGNKNCPICRAFIKTTFDINLKKQKLISSILSNSYID